MSMISFSTTCWFSCGIRLYRIKVKAIIIHIFSDFSRVWVWDLRFTLLKLSKFDPIWSTACVQLCGSISGPASGRPWIQSFRPPPYHLALCP